MKKNNVLFFVIIIIHVSIVCAASATIAFLTKNETVSYSAALIGSLGAYPVAEFGYKKILKEEK